MNEIHIPSKEEFIKGIEEFEKHEKRDAMYKVATFLVHHFWGNPSDMADGLGVLLLTWNQAFYRYGSFDFDKLEKCIENNLEKLEKFRNRDITTFSELDESDIKSIFSKFLDALQIDTIKFSDSNKKKFTIENLKELLDKWNIKFSGNDTKSIYKSIKSDEKVKDAIEFIETSRKNYIQITISRLEENQIEKLKEYNLIMKSPVAVAKALHLLAPNFFPLWDDQIAKAYRCYYDNEPAKEYIKFMKIIKEMSEKVKEYVDPSKCSKTLLKLIDEYNYSKYTKNWI